MIYDFIGAFISLLTTYYFIKSDIKAWPLSVFATCFNGWLYAQKGIYAGAFLQGFYFLSTCYGWYFWIKKSSILAPVTRFLSLKNWLMLSAGVLMTYYFIFLILTQVFHSNIAALDAITTTLSIAAQGLMCRKRIETWILWFTVDVLYAWMYLGKGLPLHAALMLVYTIMAIIGFRKWLAISGTNSVNAVYPTALKSDV